MADKLATPEDLATAEPNQTGVVTPPTPPRNEATPQIIQQADWKVAPVSVRSESIKPVTIVTPTTPIRLPEAQRAQPAAIKKIEVVPPVGQTKVAVVEQKPDISFKPQLKKEVPKVTIPRKAETPKPQPEAVITKRAEPVKSFTIPRQPVALSEAAVAVISKLTPENIERSEVTPATLSTIGHELPQIESSEGISTEVAVDPAVTTEASYAEVIEGTVEEVELQLEATTEIGLDPIIRNETEVVFAESNEAPALEPIKLTELFSMMDENTESTSTAIEEAFFVVDTEAEPDFTAATVNVAEIIPPSPATKVTTTLAERIALLDEDEAIIATTKLTTIVALAEHIHEVVVIDEEQAAVLTEQLAEACGDLLEQLAIKYDEETLRKLVTKLLDQEPEQSAASELPVESLLQKYMREITGGNPTGLVNSLGQRVKVALKNRVGLGKLAVARTATAL